jgi:hyperosmotically inducible protein
MRRMLGNTLIATILVLGPAAGWVLADTPAGAPQADISKHVTHEILMYPYYTIWDNINFRVSGGSVELTGEVTQPCKKNDVGSLVQNVPGVASVTNDIKVLPLSTMDDQLRLQVARAIYGYPALSRYGMGSLPSIHIVVDNGHVTLDGVVDTAMDKQIAGIRAGMTMSFSVTNNLQVKPSSAAKS